MTGLLSLPPELLQAIGDDLGPAKKQLRLVCNQLSAVLEPLVLSHVVIDVTRARLPTSIDQLQSLADEGRRSGAFVRELSIRALAPAREVIRPGGAQMMFSGGSWNAVASRRHGGNTSEAGTSLNKYLEEAISKMENLQVVRWNPSVDDPEWSLLAVMKGLAYSKTLSYLNLYLPFGFDTSALRFDLLHGLKRIVISGTCEFFSPFVVKRLGDCIAQSPEMNSIDVDRSLCRRDEEVPSLHCLLGNAPQRRLKHLGLHSWYTRLDSITIPHLRALKSLALLNIRDSPHDGHPFSSTAADIWSALRVNKIHLERISTDAMDASLIEYLASYSGLTRLYLKSITAPDHQSSDQLAEMFFDSALPPHSSTLEDLYVLPRYEGKWCFGEHIAPSIVRCSRLQYLKVAVISSKVNPSADYGSGRGDVINMLISMVARHLRAIKKLCITTAQAESLRGFEHAGASKKHFLSANDEIAKAILNYVPEVAYQAHLPLLTANLCKYTPEVGVDGLDARIRYRRL
ncbi:hypothetical protein NP233_g4285 [Leucocoprinus birnbaumii]|uniref:F-box domain-containing protein n=1 Tax=Leucocoprinus birnbaumii TaxID=56174 RepID=A0AAD5VYP3_9AGAR|nr:hypothetical protein NP233_g4285 [Leucocoprinus birnbaumii]